MNSALHCDDEISDIVGSPAPSGASGPNEYGVTEMSDASQPFEPIISDLSGDEDLIDIIEEFVDELPDRVSAMTTAFEEQNFEELRRLAHQLKGAAGGYGFPSITDSALQVELAADVRNADQATDKLVKDIEALTELCRRARAK